MKRIKRWWLILQGYRPDNFVKHKRPLGNLDKIYADSYVKQFKAMADSIFGVSPFSLGTTSDVVNKRAVVKFPGVKTYCRDDKGRFVKKGERK